MSRELHGRVYDMTRGAWLAVRQRSTYRRIVFALVGVAGLVGLTVQGQVFADTLYSDDYSVTETQFGSGSVLHSCSDAYCTQASTGDLTVGRSSSENYSTASGFNTTDTPTLEVITEMSNQDLGVLDETQTTTATALVKVRTYLSNGYTMQITGDTPRMGTSFLNPLLGAMESEPGTEQFGINLVANSTPSVGTNPRHVPEDTSDTSMIEDDYATPNEFKYLSGDVVASNNESTGETHYTVSMILNISNLTPGGFYTGNFSAVVTPIF